MKALTLAAITFLTVSSNANECAPIKQGALDRISALCTHLNKRELTDSPGDLLKELKALASKDSDVKKADFFAEPSDRTCSSVTYTFEESEKKIEPGNALYLAVPKSLRGRSAATLLLSHRQDPNQGNNRSLIEEEAKTGKRPWDKSPGLTSVQVHMSGVSPQEAWRHYQAPYGESGPKGSKFAEISTSPEREALEGIRAHGHKGVHSGNASTDELLVDAMRLVNTGKDVVMISGVTLKVAPPKSDKIMQAIFTMGTTFENYEAGKPSTSGGGERFDGKYKGALALPATGQGPTPKLPNGWRIIDGDLHIPLHEGYRFNGVEISAGDMHDDGSPNKDGGIGSSGWASFYVQLKKASGEIVPLMSGENVGKNGVISAFPRDCENDIQPGDKLVLSSSGDTTHVMGIRIHLQTKPN